MRDAGLTPSQPASLYHQLADKLTEDIRTGALPAGAQLPTQRDLAADIGTTVGTVGRAYTLLEERGLIVREVGRGTFVASDEPRKATEASPTKVQLLKKIDELEGEIADLRRLVERL